MSELLNRAAIQRWLQHAGLEAWQEAFLDSLQTGFEERKHGDLERWQQAIEALPAIAFDQWSFDEDAVGLGRREDCPDQSLLHQALQGLHPWRKGPFSLFGLELDSEWRSDLKWQRVSPHLVPLDGKRVLDVGCGNGYYAWRTLGQGAERVLGLDPTLLFVMQDQALRRLMQGNAECSRWAERFLLLPLGIEHLPAQMRAFDVVFSMGVFYHRRSPMDHLLELRQALQPGGQLVLETLVVEGDEGHCLVPAGRYAKMRNVWFLPSVATLEAWMRRMGFRDIHTVDVTPTTTGEQRASEWMRFESLNDFLDPDDPGKTIEGHPAPIRALVTAFG